MNELSQIKEFLPFLIPIVAIELGLLIYTIRHILTHNSYKMGNRAMWLVISIFEEFFMILSILLTVLILVNFNTKRF